MFVAHFTLHHSTEFNYNENSLPPLETPSPGSPHRLVQHRLEQHLRAGGAVFADGVLDPVAADAARAGNEYRAGPARGMALDIGARNII